jgi:hypothetical protein
VSLSPAHAGVLIAAFFERRRRRIVGERPDSLASRSNVVFLDSHGVVSAFSKASWAEQVERNVGFRIDGVAGTENDAMKPAMGVGKFALGVFGMDNRDERHEDSRSFLSVAGDVKTAARSLNWRSSSSSNRQARKASASSRESAATTKGLSLGLSSQP